MEKNTRLKIKIGVIFFALVFVFGVAKEVWGACNPNIYNVSGYQNVLFVTDSIDSPYYDPDDNSTAAGGDDCECVDTLPEVTSWLNNHPGQNNIVLLRRGDIWHASGSGYFIDINFSNVKIDSFGNEALALPIIDGQNQYPNQLGTPNPIGYQVPTGFAISIGDYSTNYNQVTNVHISHIKFQNLNPGGGVSFAGYKDTTPADGVPDTNGRFVGPGSVMYCEFNNLGTNAISINNVGNALGEAGAIHVEHNIINDVNNWSESWNCQPPDVGCTWPQAIGNMAGTSSGHICRYNTISNVYGEGIGHVFSLIEYNNISDTRSPAIYLTQSKNGDTIVRYNTIWRNANGSFSNSGGGITLDTESDTSLSTSKTEIYGNLIAGYSQGMKIRNGVNTTALWGSVRIFNNTLIDNIKNYIFANAQRFSDVGIFNNTSIITSEGVSSGCEHVQQYSNTSWLTWNFGPNHFYGGTLPGDPFYVTTGTDPDITGDPKLGKTSGWRSLSAMPNKSDYSISSTSSALYNSGKYPMSFTGKSDNTLTGVTNSYAVMPGDIIYEDDGSTGTVSSVTDNTIVLNNASSFDGSGGGLSPFQVHNSLVDMGAVEYTGGSSAPTAPSGLEVR